MSTFLETSFHTNRSQGKGRCVSLSTRSHRVIRYGMKREQLECVRTMPLVQSAISCSHVQFRRFEIGFARTANLPLVQPQGHIVATALWRGALPVTTIPQCLSALPDLTSYFLDDIHFAYFLFRHFFAFSHYGHHVCSYIRSAVSFANLSRLWTPQVASRGEYIANKLLQGLVGAPIESLIEVSLTDVYYMHERGFVGVVQTHPGPSSDKIIVHGTLW